MSPGPENRSFVAVVNTRGGTTRRFARFAAEGVRSAQAAESIKPNVSFADVTEWERAGTAATVARGTVGNGDANKVLGAFEVDGAREELDATRQVCKEDEYLEGTVFWPNFSRVKRSSAVGSPWRATASFFFLAQVAAVWPRRQHAKQRAQLVPFLLGSQSVTPLQRPVQCETEVDEETAGVLGAGWGGCVVFRS